MVKRDISPDKMTEMGAMAQATIPGRIIEVIDLGEILEETVGRVVEKATEMKGMVTINHRDRNRLRERTFVGNL